MSAISSSQLEQILSTNAKAIEIYLQVEEQYEDILLVLNEIKDKNCDHIAHNDKHIEKLSDIIAVLETRLKEGQVSIIAEQTKVAANLAKTEAIVSKQNYVLAGYIGIIILAIIGKILGLPIP